MSESPEKEKYIFEEISSDINSAIIQSNGEFVQKGKFPTDIRRGIIIYIYSADHLPIHFHVKSQQRYLNAKFQIEPLKFIENKSAISNEGDIKYITKYFIKNGDLLSEIKEKFIELNPNLDYTK